MSLEERRAVLYKTAVFAVVGEKATPKRNAAPLQRNRGGVGALPLKAMECGNSQ
jgi:hypothetical protein